MSSDRSLNSSSVITGRKKRKCRRSAGDRCSRGSLRKLSSHRFSFLSKVGNKVNAGNKSVKSDRFTDLS